MSSRKERNSVLIGLDSGQRRESNHEEVETREWNHVQCKLAQVTVELTRERETAGCSAHGSRDEIVEVATVWCRQLESTEADVLQRFIVEAATLVRVLSKLMDRQSRVVGFDDRIRYFWRGNHRGVGRNETIGILFANLRDK